MRKSDEYQAKAPQSVLQISVNDQSDMLQYLVSLRIIWGILMRLIIILPIFLVTIGGCKPRQQLATSDAKGAFIYEDVCPAARAEQVVGLKTRLNGLEKGILPEHVGQFYNALARVPDIYLEWIASQALRKENPFQFNHADFGERLLGVTTREGKAVLDIQLNSNLRGSLTANTLLHEIGHAIEIMITNPKFEEILQMAYRDGMRNRNLYRNYALTSTAEFFAELFNSIYCSPESFAKVVNLSPCPLLLLHEYLSPPVDAAWPAIAADSCNSADRQENPPIPQFKLGATLSEMRADGSQLILAVQKNSEAERSGLVVGTAIYEVNDQPLAHKNQLIYKIKESVSGYLKLLVQMPGTKERKKNHLQLTPIPDSKKVVSTKVCLYKHDPNFKLSLVGSDRKTLLAQKANVRLAAYETSRQAALKTFGDIIFSERCDGNLGYF